METTNTAIELSLTLDEEAWSLLVRIFRQRKQHAGLQQACRGLLRHGVAPALHFRLYVEATTQMGMEPHDSRIMLVRELRDRPEVLRAVIRELRLQRDQPALAAAFELLGTVIDDPAKDLSKAAEIYVSLGDTASATRVFELFREKLDEGTPLSVASYLAWIDVEAASPSSVPDTHRRPLLTALNASVLRDPKFDANHQNILAKLRSDEQVVNLVVTALHQGQGRAADKMLDYFYRQERWTMLAELCALCAKSCDDPLPYLLRGAEAWERAGAPVEADRILADIEPEIQAHRTLRDKTATMSTLMFRNMPVLEGLVALTNWLCESAGTAPRIHIAAVSTGEEAFSLAIALQEAGLLQRVKLDASDVNASAISRAREGRIMPRSLTKAPSHAGKWFIHEDEDTLRLDPRILEQISFFHWNLLEDSDPREYDILVANNLSIHLEPSAKQRLLQELAAHTSQHGFVVMGGDRHDDQAQETMASVQLYPIASNVEACYRGWTLQQHAWYVLPRPYWALPPYRPAAGGVARFATFFARSLEQAALANQRLARQSDD